MVTETPAAPATAAASDLHRPALPDPFAATTSAAERVRWMIACAWAAAVDGPPDYPRAAPYLGTACAALADALEALGEPAPAIDQLEASAWRERCEQELAVLDRRRRTLKRARQRALDLELEAAS